MCDLAAFGLPKPGPFEPFIGAGVGAVNTRIGKMTKTFPATTTVPGGSRTGLASIATLGALVSHSSPCALHRCLADCLNWRRIIPNQDELGM